MPELPDLTVYIDCLRPRIVGKKLRQVRLQSPFLLRSVQPPLSAVSDREVLEIERLGKRIVWHFAADLHIVLHLMIAGRLRWRRPGAKLPTRAGLAAFDFETGSLLLTEAGSHQRASLFIVQGADALRAHDPGGLEVLESDLASFREVLGRENHTLKRFLTSPRLLSGIGNAYSDEILHRAGLSPLQWTSKLTAAETGRLHRCTKEVLHEWTDRLRQEVGDGYPEKVTAFRPQMAVHGRYRKPCPVCASPVQRIVYAGRETNYCAACQTGGRVYADRALSRLLKKDWPKTLEEWEQSSR